MTEEQIKQKAEESFNNRHGYSYSSIIEMSKESCWEEGYCFGATEVTEELQKELADTRKVQVVEHFEAYGQCRDRRRIAELEKENAELKSKVGLSIDCEKAKKNGELCLGYGGDEDEPCEQCKNCIKCECGYYQLGETKKDEQLTKTKELLKWFVWYFREGSPNLVPYKHKVTEAEQYLNSEVEK